MRIDRRGFIVTLGVGALTACGGNGSSSSPQPGSPPQPPLTPGGGPPLTIDFSGLIAVVRPSSADDPLNFLLVDGQGTLSEPHSPFLVIPQSDVSSSTVAPDHNAIRNSRNCSFWNLAGYQLTIASTSSGTSAVTGHRPAGHQTPAAPNEEDDVSWIPEMSKIPGAGSGKINPACLSANPTSAYVAARVRCSGELAARFDPGGATHWKQRVFQFQNGSAVYAQALGLAHVSIPVSQPATLTLTPFASGPTISIVLTNGAHSIEVLNEPSMPQVGCPPPNDITHLKHFAAFYKLVDPATPPTASTIPECVGTNCPTCTTGGGVSESDYIYCPPAQF